MADDLELLAARLARTRDLIDELERACAESEGSRTFSSITLPSQAPGGCGLTPVAPCDEQIELGLNGGGAL